MSRRDSPVPAPAPSRRRAPGSGTQHVGRGGEPVPAASGPRRLLVACSLAVSAAPGTLTVYTAVVLATGAVPVVAAWFTKLLVDQLSAGAGAEGTAGRLPALAVGLALVGALAAVSPHLAQYLRAQLNRRVGLLAMDRLFTAVERFTGLRHFENPRFFDRLRLAQQAGRVSPNETVDGALGAARAAVTMTGFLGALFTLSPPMTGLVLVSGIPLLTAEIAMSRRRARTLWAIGPAERREAFYGDLLSNVRAAKEVRLFGIGSFLRGRMLHERRAADAATRAVDRKEVWTQGGLGLLAAAIAGGGLVWAVAAARRGQFTVGDVMIFAAAVAGIQGALITLAGDIARMHQASRMLDHFVAVTTAASDLPLPAHPVPLPTLRGGIEMRDVWFRYADDQPWVLRGVSLTIPHGTALGLVGLNGAGKSTLVKLLCRLYDPTRGAVLWDGVDLRETDPAELRARISAVFQDYMQYDLTAAENIALGDLTALDDRERLHAAARRAGVHETLTRLRWGYDTLLSRTFFPDDDQDGGGGDDGRNGVGADNDRDGGGADDAKDRTAGVVLSGGQWQRLALARALLRHDRDLMILDEPSSGLDAAAEHEVHTSLRHHRRERTSLLVSHRLGALREADRIVVLSGGRVIEQGTHGELMAMRGEYARLFTLQAEGYQQAADGEQAALTRQGQL